mmetsp:Transcript_11684/g.35458  ORF Transcript_11684/g.35458 Transcript_11684/m.35458 type:complete len:121 (+) Transcript_11684:156-518(+)
MGDGEIQEWSTMWGARVKVPCDMGDDMLKDAVETTRSVFEEFPDFENDGLKAAEAIKLAFDEKWTPNWHVVVGRGFGIPQTCKIAAARGGAQCPTQPRRQSTSSKPRSPLSLLALSQGVS